MRLLSSMSSRFARSHDYTVSPEHNRATRRGTKMRISLTAPAGQHDRSIDNRGGRNGRRR
jgi:hypothetical protein